jgi:hypothetical protein
MDYDEKKPLLATPAGSVIQGGEIKETKPKKTCGLQIQLSPKVILYFSLLVITGIANNVAGRWNQEKFGQNYAFFNGQFYVFNYAILAQIMSSYKYFCTKDITPEMKRFPVWKYAMFAAFDAAAAFLFTMGAPNTPATLQNIINQTIIPITMLATAVIIRVRYQWLKIGGAGIIMLGAGVAIIPLFFDTGSNKIDFVWYAVLIYFLNNIPQSLSNVTKELAFNGLDMDVWYLGAWVGWFQVLFTAAMLPLTVFPAFGGIAFRDMPDQLAKGFWCWLGYNSLPGDNCSYNYVATTIYIVINFFYNIFILLVTKHASATMFTLAFAIRLPLTQIAYCIPFIMQQYVEPFTWESIVSLVVVLAGFVLYSMLPEPQQQKKEVEKILEDENKKLLA